MGDKDEVIGSEPTVSSDSADSEVAGWSWIERCTSVIHEKKGTVLPLSQLLTNDNVDASSQVTKSTEITRQLTGQVNTESRSVGLYDKSDITVGGMKMKK